MKTVISMTLAVLLCVGVNAQVSDPYLTVTYKGYTNGKYVFQLDNHQSCHPKTSVDVRINWSSDVTPTGINPQTNGNDWHDVTIGDGSTTVSLTANYSPKAVFYFQALTQCDWKGSGSTVLTVNTASSLPVTFTGAPKIVSVNGNQAIIQFNVANQTAMSSYNVKLSVDLGKTWQVVTVVPANKESGYTYQATVKLY